MESTKVTVVKQIRIVRSGPGILHTWEFDEDDAAVIWEALKEYFDASG